MAGALFLSFETMLALLLFDFEKGLLRHQPQLYFWDGQCFGQSGFGGLRG